MGLPNPIPDNPLRWDGWKNYASDYLYERLCLNFEGNPSAAQIEDHCRQLLTWWQKKLPLKNQPSNPLAQLLRSAMDDAPGRLAEARAVLADPISRARFDSGLLAKAREGALTEFNKFLAFVLTSGELADSEEDNLYTLGEGLGLTRAEMKFLVDEELDKWGMRRISVKGPQPVPEAPAPAAPATPAVSAAAPQNPREEFLRMLRLSGIDEITDDQRDAFCNMGEALGLSGGDAEDVIDEYLEERMNGGCAPAPSNAPKPAAPAAYVAKPATPPASTTAAFSNTPLLRVKEKEQYPPFSNTAGISMLLVPSGSFMMGSNRPDAAPNEHPLTRTNLTAFYCSRWPVTNAQFEQFDPTHRSRRIPGADDRHPVVYVSALEAGRFCDWLSQKERKKYRLPSEAEWEYAACGIEPRTFPWGETWGRPVNANFADVNKKLPWADASFDCGFAATSPVGSFPRGASPFGIEDMAGNVWEWCLDCFSAYPGKERSNPRGTGDSSKRIHRGGSWKSRAASLRVSARAFNAPEFSANDVGFRIVCEVK